MKKRTKVGGVRTKARRPKATKLNLRDGPKVAPRSQSLRSGEGAEVSRLTRELNEALERETANSRVLQAISSSSGDLEQLFTTMLAEAIHICGAQFGNIYRWDGEALHSLATHKTPSAFAEARQRISIRPGEKNPVGQMNATKKLVHTIDMAGRRGEAIVKGGSLWKP